MFLFVVSVVLLKMKVTHDHSENYVEIENQIVEKLNQLQDKAIPKSEEVWRYLSQLKRGNIEIVSSQWEKGVVVWCWCRSKSALNTFEALSVSDVKQPNLLNGLFNLLLPEINAPMISSVYLDNYEDEIGKMPEKLKYHVSTDPSRGGKAEI